MTSSRRERNVEDVRTAAVFRIDRLLPILPLIAALIYAPLAFGGTTRETAGIIDMLLFASFGGWLIGLLLYLRLPNVPRLFWGTIAVLVAVGLCSLANPAYVRVPGSWELIPLFHASSILPSTVDQEASTQAVVHFGALLAGLVVLVDLLSVREVRWLFVKVVAICGLFVAAIGMLQKASESEAMLWATPDQSGEVFFGAFRYHTNAAAFLLLSWPASFALWVRSLSSRSNGLVRSLWFVSFFFTWVSLFVNTSKVGHLLAILSVCVSVILFRKLVFVRTYSSAQKFVSGILLLAAAGIAVYPAFSAVSERWSEAVTVGGSITGRIEAYHACVEAIGSGGFWGYGPGTFSLIFPYFTEGLAQQPGGFWRYAHQDYLQILIEWGWGGFCAVAILVVGGVVKAWKSASAARREGRKEISATSGLIAVGTILILAAVDFPLQIPAIQILFLVYLAGLWSLGKQRSHHRLHRSRQRERQDKKPSVPELGLRL